MITTVITTVVISAGVGLTVLMGMVAVGSLIAFLITREVASAGGSEASLRIARFVGVGIVPLIIAFAVIAVVRITEVLA